ncbi:MAG: pilus assembly PilX N-terminal domain-containing protein [Candidatus Gastranaerophilales bacterium]|nr:pilus assembly PilX N-terminal domain-containing protein [Candidatus Gastranaerophilales bacterium]
MYKKSEGSVLLIAIFISLVAVLLVVSMSSLSTGNVKQISNYHMGKLAYYASEAGIAEVTNYFNTSFLNWGKTLDETSLPVTTDVQTLDNGAAYWVDNITYTENNKIAVIDLIGKYKDSYRKVRARIQTSIPKYFDDYGLLTDGVITINGNKTLYMSIHANDGIILSGPTSTQNDSIVTQSEDPDAEEPDPETNPIGGYVDPIEVPLVPVDDLRTFTQTGINLDISQADLSAQIANAPAGSLIYIGDATNSSNDSITITGDMQGKVIFVDKGIVVNAQGVQNLSNVMIISSAGLTVNGSVDFLSSHDDQLDTVFACNNDITLNGSRIFKSLFWTNGSFRQNGTSMAGRVISQNGITFKGNFTLTATSKLYDFGTFDNVASLSSWQQVSMDN